MSLLDEVGNAAQNAFAPQQGNTTLLAKKFQTGSFRGAKFLLETVESEFGRRTTDRDYPKRETPHSEDLGKKAREYNFEAFVLGPDYERDRDALTNACDTQGPGTLIHPYYGKKLVVCKVCKVKESKGTLGQAVFTLTFREAGQLIYPSATTDDGSAIATAASTLTTASAADLGAKLAAAVTSASDVFNMVVSRVNQTAKLIQRAALSITHTLQGLQNFAYAVKNMEAQAQNLAALPSQLGSQIQSTMALLSSMVTGTDRTQVIQALSSLYTVTPTTFQEMDIATGITPLSILPNSTTPDAAQLTLMEQAIANHVARCAMAQAATEAVANVYPDFPTAIAMQTQLTEQCDTMATAIGANPALMDTDDTNYEALTALRAQIFKSVPPASQDLPLLGTYTPLIIIPSLVVTYDLYGDGGGWNGGGASQYEPGLVARNEIRNPGMIPALKVLEVLKGITTVAQ